MNTILFLRSALFIGNKLTNLSSSRCVRELFSDLSLHALVAIYLVFAVVLSISLGSTERLVPFAYIIVWGVAAYQMKLAYFLAIEVPRSVLSGSKTPVTDALRGARNGCGSRWLAGLAMTVSMAVFHGTFTSVKNMLPLITPYWCDKQLADLGAALHGGRSPWFWLQPLLGSPLITRAIEFLYAPVWFLLLVGFPTLLSLRAGAESLYRRYVVAMILCFVLLGNLLAGLGMSAGPVYYGRITGDYGRFADLVAYLQFNSAAPFSAWNLQQYLWECLRRGSVELGTGISAFPSLHVAMATLFAWTASRIDRRLGVVMIAYLVVIVVGSIHLGWHYAVDGYVSLAAASAIWWLAGRITAPSRAPSRAEPALPPQAEPTF